MSHLPDLPDLYVFESFKIIFDVKNRDLCSKIHIYGNLWQSSGFFLNHWVTFPFTNASNRVFIGCGICFMKTFRVLQILLQRGYFGKFHADTKGSLSPRGLSSSKCRMIQSGKGGTRGLAWILVFVAFCGSPSALFAQRLSITPPAVTVMEGNSGEVTVVLSSAPASNVTVNIVRSNGTEIRLSKTELTFTPSNWNIIQTVTLTAADDEDLADDEETLIFIARGDDYEGSGISVHPEAVTIDSLGQSVQLSAIIQDQDGSPVTGVSFNWSSADSSVAVVDSTGKVTAVGLGMTAITATLDAIPETATISGEATVQVASDGITDRDVLVALYHATDGPNWVDNTNWLTDAPLGEWYGVETDNAGRVVGLRLRGRWDNEVRRYIPHLSGSIPPELGDLASLSSLDLSRNDLSGPIPPELGNLANLSLLNLERNNLSVRFRLNSATLPI